MKMPRLSNFNSIGHYQNKQFIIDDKKWLKPKVVYIWAHRKGNKNIPIRIGIACGKDGLRSRYNLHNRWLKGKFKQNDAREQKIRRLTLKGLKNYAKLLALEVSNRRRARSIEKRLRNLHSKTLRLDLMVKDSWIKKEMNRWRERGKR